MAISARSLNGAYVAIVLMACATLSACGDGAGPGATANTAPTTPGTSLEQGNSAALTISGAPAASVTASNAYTFTPAVTPATPSVAFSVVNLPPWASFDPQSGTVSGTPTAAQVGTYTNIVVSATNGTAKAVLRQFSITVTQTGTNAGSAALSWTPPTENTDGSPVANLAGYNIYFGPSESAMTNKISITNPGLTAYTVADLGSGTHYFGITAYTAGGIESGISSVGSKTIM